jgi:microcystin-dependent protein
MPLVPLSGTPVFDGPYPVEGARLYAFDAGTTTPRALFLTKDLDPTRVHPRPVLLANGVLPVMWAGVGDYDIAITDRFGAQIRRISGLPGDAPPVSDSEVDPKRQVRTGTLIALWGTGRTADYVRASGGTMGSGASDATERANDDCHDLFVHLYNADPSLVVIGGRSAAGAEADWSANKTITLPDLRERFLLGVADGVNLGAIGGEKSHALTVAELAAHGHDGSTVTISPAGAHTPSGTVQAAGQHAHPIDYNAQTAYATPGAGGAANSVGQAPANNSGVTGQAGQHGHGWQGDAVPDHTHAATVMVASAGSGTPHNNMPPYAAVTFYIKL